MRRLIALIRRIRLHLRVWGLRYHVAMLDAAHIHPVSGLLDPALLGDAVRYHQTRAALEAMIAETEADIALARLA